MKVNRKILGLALVLVALTVLLAKTTLFATNETTAPADEERGVVTTLMEVKPQTLLEEITYLGTLQGSSTASLTPKVNGDVRNVQFEEGDVVTKNATLITLDQTQLLAKQKTVLAQQAKLEQQINYLTTEVETFYTSNPLMAKIATLDEKIAFQQNELDKLTKLYEAGALSQSALDQAAHQLQTLQNQKQELLATATSNYNQLAHEQKMAQHELRQIEANLSEVNLSLADTRITAPFAGQVGQVFVEEGDFAMSGKPVLTLHNMKELKVTTQVGETDLAQLTKGMQATITLAGGSHTHSGEVTFVSSNVNPQTRIGTVEVTLAEDIADVPLGASAQVNFIITQQEEQLMVPQAAVKQLQEKSVVYVYNSDGRVYQQTVTLGRQTDDQVQVLTGLDEGQHLAISNLNSLYDGTLVYLLEEEPK